MLILRMMARYDYDNNSLDSAMQNFVKADQRYLLFSKWAFFSEYIPLRSENYEFSVIYNSGRSALEQRKQIGYWLGCVSSFVKQRQFVGMLDLYVLRIKGDSISRD